MPRDDGMNTKIKIANQNQLRTQAENPTYKFTWNIISMVPENLCKPRVFEVYFILKSFVLHLMRN